MSGEWTDCPECGRLMESQGWAILNACASVGVERGEGTTRLIGFYMDGFHRQGHPAMVDTRPLTANP